MYNVKLTIAEHAALCALVERELQYAYRSKAEAAQRVDMKRGITMQGCGSYIVYWSERIYMLQKLKDKLEREEQRYDDR